MPNQVKINTFIYRLLIHPFASMQVPIFRGQNIYNMGGAVAVS